MKHEIEIPDFPEGYEIGKPKVVYAHMGDNNPVISIPLKKKQPRRIVLEETGRYRGLHYSIDINDGNLILPPGREYKIVDDKNETRD